MSLRGRLLAVLAIALVATMAKAQEPVAGIPPIDSKPYSIGGLVEFRPVAIWQDTGASVFRLRAMAGESPDARTAQANGRLQVDAGYRRGWFSVQTRSVVESGYSGGDWTTGATLYESYVSVKPAPSLTVDAGKKTLKWGKGYLWNPAAFLDRPKSPDDPALALEGFTVLLADYIRTFDGPLQVVSVTPVLLPVSGDLNQSFGERGLNAAGKLYLLFADTDIDLMFLAGGSRPARFGFDVSRNLRSNLEVHGEWMHVPDAVTTILGPRDTLAERRGSATSAVAGFRYLTSGNTTFIVDYFRNGGGYTTAAMDAYFDLIDRGHASFVQAGDPGGLALANRATEAGYGRSNPMLNYAYGRVSQPDALGVLYLTLGASAIVNLDDGSHVLMPEVQYKPSENVEIRWLGNIQRGGKGTEFGEKPADLRVEIRARYYF